MILNIVLFVEIVLLNISDFENKLFWYKIVEHVIENNSLHTNIIENINEFKQTY